MIMTSKTTENSPYCRCQYLSKQTPNIFTFKIFITRAISSVFGNSSCRVIKVFSTCTHILLGYVIIVDESAKT